MLGRAMPEAYVVPVETAEPRSASGTVSAFMPWLFPDRPAWPTFTLLPGVALAESLLSRAQEAVTSAVGEVRSRVAAAWAVLRWGSGE